MTFAIELGAPVLGVGLVMGLAYALLAIGLVLIYRTTRVIHFGYGEIGAFGAVTLAILVLDHGMSWWLAFPLTVILGAVIGAAWELVVIRRLFDAPRLLVLVATIGMAQVMFAAQLLLPDHEGGDLYPTPIDVQRSIGGFVLRGDHVLVLLAVPVLGGGLAWFLNRTVWGLAIRGSAQNADAAMLAGVRVRHLSTMVWALGGALATVTFVLILPVRGVVLGQGSQALGASLLLRALAVGLIGRMESLAWTAVGGVLFGLFEAAVVSNVSSSGTVDLAVFAGVMLLLLLRGSPRGELGGSASAGWLRERSSRGTDHPAAMRVRRWCVGLGLVMAVCLPFVFDSPGRLFTFSAVLVFAIVGISVTVVTGWAGQLSLCQFTFVGMGAMVTAGLTARGMGFGWAAVYASGVTAAAATAVGFPALRIRGLFLATVTLAFAVAGRSWILERDEFKTAAGATVVPRGRLGPFDFGDQRTYYFMCLAVLVALAWVVRSLRRTGIGRSIVAVRENETAASAATVSPARMKLLAFALSGGIAGLAGALYGGLYVNVRVADFGAEQSLQVLTMGIIGGVGSIGGALLGSLYVVGIPAFLDYGAAASILTSGIGVLVLVLFARGGLMEVAQRCRDRLFARRLGLTDDVPPTSDAADRKVPQVTGGAAGAAARSTEANEPMLQCVGVDVRFAGLVANQSINLEVRPNEVLGIIGTNGAGKSTLLNAISGFVSTSAGTITALGHDITAWAPHERARLGIGRVFQDAGLYPELEVAECLMVGLEAGSPSELVPSLLSLGPSRRSERYKRSEADDLLCLMGLGEYARSRVADLSTGTRRIVELACLIAGRPRLILLDEPTAGIAQREVEAFSGVLHSVRAHLGATLLLVEHDMPLVMSISDRIVCMSAGRVIAEGDPAAIRHDPAVVASYLGTDERAISRSGNLLETKAMR